MVKRVMEQGMSPRRVAEQLGVNASTVYKWLRRYREGGLAALPDRSSRPHKSPRRLPVERVATLAALRRMRLSSPAIAFTLSLPVSSVTNELRRLGLSKPSRLEPRPPVVRHEHQAPGDMIHLDIKKPGRIDGVGHRITATAQGTSAEPAGSTRRSAWTAMAAWPAPSSCPTRRPPPPPASCSAPPAGLQGMA